jgi:CheY-like chemotaxis protein
MSEKRIYFAADDQLVAVLWDPLQKTGLTVETFARQADLIAAALADPPDVLLLGARLPDGSALAAFKALEPNPPPTLVILTASQLASRFGLLRAGISDIVVSPIRPRALASRLAELAGGTRRMEVRERTSIPVMIDLDGRHVRGFTQDLSRDGLGLRLDAALTEQAIVGVTLNPPSGSSIKVFGRVAHCRLDGDVAVVGMRFLGASQDEEATLAHIAQAHPALDDSAQAERTPTPRPARAAESERPRERPRRKATKTPVAAAKPTQWPEGVFSLLEAIDALRRAVDLTSAIVAGEQPLPDPLPETWVKDRTAVEVAAISLGFELTPIERRAFEPEPEIVVVLDDLDDLPRPSPAPVKAALDPTLAALLCVGAAHRLRASLVEEVGRSMVGPEGRRSARGLRNVTIDDSALDELLTSMRRWMQEAQQLIAEVEFAGIRELTGTLRILQDAMMQQASTLTEVRILSRDAAARATPNVPPGALSRLA